MPQLAVCGTIGNVESAPRQAERRDDAAAHGGRTRVLRAVLEGCYVLGVTAVAVYGFVAESTAAILGAVALALPSGLPALVGYYVAYGLLAQVPGANPSTNTGFASCSQDGSCHGSESGGLAPWFAHTMDVVGVLALAVAAIANVVLLRLAAARLRASRSG